MIHIPQPPQGEKEVVPGQDYSKQRLILGTHTSDNEQNYLMLAEVRVCACLCMCVRVCF